MCAQLPSRSSSLSCSVPSRRERVGSGAMSTSASYLFRTFCSRTSSRLHRRSRRLRTPRSTSCDSIVTIRSLVARSHATVSRFMNVFPAHSRPIARVRCPRGSSSTRSSHPTDVASFGGSRRDERRARHAQARGHHGSRRSTARAEADDCRSAPRRPIDDDLAAKLGGTSHLRNRIAHGYATVDVDRLWTEIPDGLKTFEAFVKALAKFVERQTGSTSP